MNPKDYMFKYNKLDDKKVTRTMNPKDYMFIDNRCSTNKYDSFGVA